jgi:D-sedoheptulose 7-phosphate isomerase
MTASYPQLYKAEVLKAVETIDLEKVAEAIRIFIQASAEGRQIFVCGNGGSTPTVSHFVTDIVKGASFDWPARFRIMALTDSLPTIMAYSNDVGYDRVFVEQLKNFARPGDVVRAFSGSGNSPNVVRALIWKFHRLPHRRAYGPGWRQTGTSRPAPYPSLASAHRAN